MKVHLVACLYIFLLQKVTSYENVCHCERNCDDFPQAPCHFGCNSTWFGNFCQRQNIAQGKPAKQSSEQYQHGCPCIASRAVDGDTNTMFRHGSCSLTDDTDNTGAIWTVDLTSGSPINISNIQLSLRDENGSSYNGLKVFVDHTLCFESTKTFPETLNKDDQNLDIKCSKVLSGKSVSVQVTGKMLSLCEVQVFVCSDGWFGDDCDKQCECLKRSDVCDKQTGYCRGGCAAGKQGPGCQQDCSDGMFGSNCNKQCQCATRNETCDKTTGHCGSGCSAGKKGNGCQTDCDDGRFGFNCSNHCQCHNEICDKKTGHCEKGCVPGKMGDNCQKDCHNGTFGLNCTNHCQCETVGEICDKKTGHCASGCQIGKQGDDCQSDCMDGTFGQNCYKQCLCSKTDDICNKITGHCDSGCTPGKQGDDCQTDCRNGTFGFNCTNHCHCAKAGEICDKKTGHCESGCPVGKQGDGCQSDCADYTYGENCVNVCYCKNMCEVCNKVTGACNTGQQTTLSTTTNTVTPTGNQSSETSSLSTPANTVTPTDNQSSETSYFSTPANTVTHTGSQSSETSSCDHTMKTIIYLAVLGSFLGVACIVLTVLAIHIVRLKRQIKEHKKREECYVALKDRNDTNYYDYISGYLNPRYEDRR